MSKDSRQVNHLLHTLRGEQFRHQQNVHRSRTHLSALPSHNTPTLPSIVASLQYYDQPQVISQKLQSPYAGPAPPKSWTSDESQQDHRETVAWRSQALSLAASHIDGFIDLSQPPSLALTCLKILLANCTPAEMREDIAPFVPVHLRRDFIRYSAIHFPLPDWKLDVLFYPDGHADGEILVVGPKVTLRDDYFLRGSHELLHFNSRPPQPDEDWESESLSVKPLQSLLMVSTRLSTSTLLSLPPTLTHIALINIHNPIPLHRFPKICPLLEFLDLSYNRWLGQPGEAISKLDRVEWTRWVHLRVLGLRDCHVPEDILQKVNRGRWDDVAIVTD